MEKKQQKEAVVKERISEEDYRIELSNGKNRVLSIKSRVDYIVPDNE